MTNEVIEARARNWYGLTERQAELAAEYVERANLKGACRSVGYDYRDAKRLLAEHRGFQAAIREYLFLMQTQDVVRARLTALELMRDADSEKVRLDAAKFLWERADGKAVQRVVHEDEPGRQMSRSDLIRRIEDLAGKLGLRVEAGKVIDVTPDAVEEVGAREGVYENGDDAGVAQAGRAPPCKREDAGSSPAPGSISENADGPVGPLRGPSSPEDELEDYTPPIPDGY